jgi:hypothetical protein
VKRRYNRAALVLGALVLALGAAIPARAEFPMAGVDPSQRPQGAPRISEVVRGPDWYARALTGISQPYPASLRFLEDQGNWYTPFIHPGMPGRYDLRGWHSQ